MSDKKRTVALGFFDGVHIGHGALMKKVRERAAETGTVPSVLSFDEHPDNLVFGGQLPLINDTMGREDIMRRLYGIEDVVFMHFDRQLMQMPWRDFADMLVSEYNAAWVVIGHDFSFGSRGEGSPQRMQEYCREQGLGCDIIEPVMLDGRVVSSTYIRELIAGGDMEQAMRYLGHPHSLAGTVCSGYHLGTKMGTPTINMSFPEGVLVPKHGVYVSKVALEDGSVYTAATNVGVRPTVDRGSGANVESYILDFSGNLYGHRARVDFYSYIRPEQRFDGLDSLAASIKNDAETSRSFFSNFNPPFTF